MEKMQDIYSLIQCLTSAEWQSFHDYLRCFSSHKPSELKQLGLATILREADVCPEENACCIKLYGAKKNHNFTELKSSLKEKVLDFLLTDVSADKQHELDEADYAIVKMKKRSAQFQQLYYSKKRMPFLYGLLDTIISSAREYEQYFVLVDHLKAKKNMVSHKIGKTQFDQINEEMAYGSMCSSIYNKAEHYYYELMMLSAYSGKLDKPKILPSLKKNIEEIKTGFERTNSPMINYYLKNLEMGYSQLNEDHRNARSFCLELLNIVRNNKSVYRKQRLGVVYDNLSQCEFYLDNFKQAAECAREAQKLFNQNSDNYCIAIEQEFYSLFAQREYEQSTVLAKKMLASSTRKELGEFRFSKYNYLLANSLFKQRKFEDVKNLLFGERAISKDKAGWEIGARLLSIMTQIEMLKLDEARLTILSLREFLKYTDKKTPVSHRDKTILNLLLILERAGFMFGSLNGSTQKHLATLSSKDEKNRWEPFTHEVIPFHEWFAGKMKIKMPVPAVSPSRKALLKEKVSTR